GCTPPSAARATGQGRSKIYASCSHPPVIVPFPSVTPAKAGVQLSRGDGKRDRNLKLGLIEHRIIVQRRQRSLVPRRDGEDAARDREAVPGAQKGGELPL